MQHYADRPKRALLAYCALADRLQTPGVTAIQSLMPFFSEACTQFAGQLFDAQKFSDAVADRYGIRIPRLAALGFTEHLANEGILVDISGLGSGSVYRYAQASALHIAATDSPVTEADVEQILTAFTAYCREDEFLESIGDDDLHTEFFDRLLNIDSMKLLARREASISAKNTPNTIIRPKRPALDGARESQELHLDFIASQFLLDLRDNQPTMFELVSKVAFANMAAEAITCFLEPIQSGTKLTSLTIFLDSPLLLDMLGVNEEYSEYGKELLGIIRESGAKPAVLDHCVAEAETAVHAKLSYLRSGVNQISFKWGTSSKLDLLNALAGNVGDRAERRLNIEVQRDPEVNLHRRAPSTVGDIEAEMDTRMQAWRNVEAKDHDRKSVWSMLAIRDIATPCPRVCDAAWLMLTRNTALVSIANEAWTRWLKGTTKFSSNHIEKWAPVAMSDKQFAGYVWARNGGASISMPRARLLAHCSAAVRPRADVKAKAYNLVLELNGKEEANDVAALLEDREGARALMRATRGDPEDVTVERLPFILEKVKLGAGEFAAARVREESELKIMKLGVTHTAEKLRILDELAAAETIRAAENVATEAILAKKQKESEDLAAQNLALKNSLLDQQKADVQWAASVLDAGLNAGAATFRGFRWAITILFGLLTAAASYLSNVSPMLSLALTGILGAFGFWFVPELLTTPFNLAAMRTLRKVMQNKDPSIPIPSQIPDFRNHKQKLP